MQKHKPKGRKAAARLVDLRMSEHRRFCVEFRDFNGKLKVLAENGCFALGSAWGGFGGRSGHWRRPFWRHGATLVSLGLPLWCLWGSCGLVWVFLFGFPRGLPWAHQQRPPLLTSPANQWLSLVPTTDDDYRAPIVCKRLSSTNYP